MTLEEKHLKLLLVISTLRRGGAERVMSELAGHWARHGHNVTLVTLGATSSEDYPLDSSVRRESLDLFGPARTPLHALLGNFRRVVALRARMRRLAPDAVISFVSKTNVLTLLGGVGLKLPILVSERVDPRAHQESRIWSVLRSLLYRRASRIVVQTESVREWAAQFAGDEHVSVIPNPIGLDPSVEQQPETRVVLGMGRLVPQKGFDLLISAFANAGLADEGWQLTILGDGPLESELRRLADRLGIGRAVNLPGASSVPEQVMAGATLFVLPSRYEGFPNVLLEAMALGLPCIAFDCPSGPGEVLTHGDNGLLIPAEDVGLLSAALRQLAGDRDLRASLGVKARAVQQRYSIDRIAALWERAIVDTDWRS